MLILLQVAYNFLFGTNGRGRITAEKKFHDQSPQKLCGLSGIQTCYPLICRQKCYWLHYGGDGVLLEVSIRWMDVHLPCICFISLYGSYWPRHVCLICENHKTFINYCKFENWGCVHQGPVVQSVVSLTSSLRVISLTVLADSICNILKFFAEKM